MQSKARTLYRWPLNSNPFTFIDRLKLALFTMDGENGWTCGAAVARYERAIADYCEVKHAIYTSSGSTANTLLAMHRRDMGNRRRRIVVLPAVTWQTSASPWIREGFEPVFLDVSMMDLSMSVLALEGFLRERHLDVACVFVTSLLGLVPDVERLAELSNRYSVPVMLDNCEASLSRYNSRHICSYFTSTISTYFGHHIQSIEGGFVLTDDDKLADYCRMGRNHGLTRSLEHTALYRNPDVDARFDFAILGNNFRNTDFNATAGLLDFTRAAGYITRRRQVCQWFDESIDKTRYWTVEERRGCFDVPFALPLIRRNEAGERRQAMVDICDGLNIETRPILSGNLLRQTPYRRWRQPHCVAEFLHQGIYVGLGCGSITQDHVLALTQKLNAL